MTFKPDYEIPPCESNGGDAWYATTVLEYIISSYRYSHPSLYDACWRAYREFCIANDAYPGELSPTLGVFFNGWKNWFIGRYMQLPNEMLAKLMSNEMKSELDYWHKHSHANSS